MVVYGWCRCRALRQALTPRLTTAVKHSHRTIRHSSWRHRPSPCQSTDIWRPWLPWTVTWRVRAGGAQTHLLPRVLHLHPHTSRQFWVVLALQEGNMVRSSVWASKTHLILTKCRIFILIKQFYDDLQNRKHTPLKFFWIYPVILTLCRLPSG